MGPLNKSSSSRLSSIFPDVRVGSKVLTNQVLGVKIVVVAA